MRGISRFKHLKHLLLVAFLLLSITPMMLIAGYFLNAQTGTLAAKSSDQLALLLDNQKQSLQTFMQGAVSQAQGFAQSELATASGGRFYGLVGAYKKLGDIDRLRHPYSRGEFFRKVLVEKPRPDNGQNSASYVGHERYRLIYQRYQRSFEQYLNRSVFSDILLVDLSGQVVYAADNAEYFGLDLARDVGAPQQLRQLYSQLDSNPPSDKVLFSDFAERTDSVAGKPGRAWLAAPIEQQGFRHSYVFFALDTTVLRRALTDSSSLHPEVKNLVLGADRQLRLSSAPGVVTGNGRPLRSEAIDIALAGRSGVGSLRGINGEPVLAAWSPVNVLGYHWALVLELEESIAFASISRLESFMALAMLAAVALVSLVALWLANSITAPLLRLTGAAERVSAGNLEQPIERGGRQDEIGRLAASFASMQHSVREQLALISAQKAELQQQNSELQAADKLKDEFLATTSHELRTPLYGMIGLAENLLATDDSYLTPAQHHQLKMLVGSGQRLTALVDDLLDYHKMRYGDLAIHTQAVDLSAAVSLVLELCAHLRGDKPLRIINQLPDDLPLISADSQRLEQVLYNLIGNAIKFTSEGKVVITALVEAGDDADTDTASETPGRIRLDITDTGPGIAQEHLDAIFEPLVQARTGDAGYRPGAGLGLSISRRLSELMSAELSVSSQLLIGSTFSLTLQQASQAQTLAAPDESQHYTAPVVELPENLVAAAGGKATAQGGTAEPHADSSQQVTAEDPDGPLLLVVDDEPVNLELLTNLLRFEGYRVLCAENGLQALAMLEQHQPALVLLDIMMPQLNGFEVCKRIRAQHSASQLPVILLSALGQVKDRLRGFELGASDYLLKPFNRAELVARIDAHLRAADSEQQRQQNRQLTEQLQQSRQAESTLCELLTVSGQSGQGGQSSPEQLGHIEQLRELGDDYALLADRLVADSSQQDRQQQLRQLLVDAMVAALQLWESASGKSKYDLAEQSGLWRVYLDRSTLQTRTLDKYLQLETLPRTPRWRTVLSTLEYTLEHCQSDSAERAQVSALHQQLRDFFA